MGRRGEPVRVSPDAEEISVGNHGTSQSGSRQAWSCRPDTGRNRHRVGVAVRIGAAALVVGGVVIGVQLVRHSQAQPAGVSVSIDSPAPGASVASPVSFMFAVDGARVGAPEEGADHLHVSLDGGLPLGLYQESFSAPLSAGKHTLVVELADAAHESLGVSARETFTITRSPS